MAGGRLLWLEPIHEKPQVFASLRRSLFFVFVAKESVLAPIVQAQGIKKPVCIRFRQKINSRSAFATAA